jgi:hypothetical protein
MGDKYYCDRFAVEVNVEAEATIYDPAITHECIVSNGDKQNRSTFAWEFDFEEATCTLTLPDGIKINGMCGSDIKQKIIDLDGEELDLFVDELYRDALEEHDKEHPIQPMKHHPMNQAKVNVDCEVYLGGKMHSTNTLKAHWNPTFTQRPIRNQVIHEIDGTYIFFHMEIEINPVYLPILCSISKVAMDETEVTAVQTVLLELSRLHGIKLQISDFLSDSQ